jgi:dUTP pyrophosphatase
MKIKLKAKRISTTATMPIYSTDQAACADIYCDLRVNKYCELNPYADYKHMKVNTDCFQRLYIAPHETVKIPTGWAFQPESGYMLQLLQRSGLASKGLICVGGILDEDYTGEVIVIMLNTTDNYLSINNGDRIAQMAVRPYYQAEFEEVDKLDETERGTSGFGSTGV